MKHYWKGPLNFPADAGTLTFEKVKFNTENDNLTMLSEADETDEHLITGLDSDWLLFNQLQGNRNPVRLLTLEVSEVPTIYEIKDVKELVKVKRFDLNSKVHAITSGYKRSTY